MPGQPAGASIYSYGSAFLFDIENDPLERHDLASSLPAVVADLSSRLAFYNASGIDQGGNTYDMNE